MFNSGREVSTRRRSRPYGVNKAARSSKLSLLSAFTTTSSGSGGSNSTITQESYSRSRSNEKGKAGKRKKTRTTKMKENISSEGDGQRDLEVFNFLVQEDEKKGRIHNQSQEDAHVDDSDPECYYRSHLSDSGISMGDSSIDGHDFQSHRRLHSLPEEPYPVPILIQPPPHQVPFVDRRWSWNGAFPNVPSPETLPPMGHNMGYDIAFQQPQPWMIEDSALSIGASSTNSASHRGSRIDINEKGISRPPAFRSFAKINTRLILQMQDDIADLEEELSRLDTTASQQSEHLESQHDSSSGSGYGNQARRIEIYQILHVKLEQYQRALFAYNKLDSISKPATLPVISEHEQWLGVHVSPSSRLPHLLGDDLRRFDDSIPEYDKRLGQRSVKMLAYAASVNGLLPLLLFKLFGDVLNRLILLMLIMAASALVLGKLDLRLEKEVLFFGSALSGLCLCAAVIL